MVKDLRITGVKAWDAMLTLLMIFMVKSKIYENNYWIKVKVIKRSTVITMIYKMATWMVLNNLRQVQDTFIQNLLSKIIQLWTQISWKRLRMLKQLELMKVMSMILLQDKLKSLKEMKKMIKELMIKNGKSTDKIIHA